MLFFGRQHITMGISLSQLSPLTGSDVRDQCELRSKKVPRGFCSFTQSFALSMRAFIELTTSLSPSSDFE